MTMLAGYKLIRLSDGAVIAEWGGVYGACPAVPSQITVPEGYIHGAVPGCEYNGYRLDLWDVKPSAADVKNEAGRRITERFPIWKQLNMLATGIKLHDNLRVNGSLSVSETVLVGELEAAWAWISLVRAASNDIEKSSPIPEDFTNDGRWPKAP